MWHAIRGPKYVISSTLFSDLTQTCDQTPAYTAPSQFPRSLRSRPKKEGVRERETRVTPSRALVLSCAHYFQAPATQATSQKVLGFALTHFFLQPSRAKLLQNTSQLKTFSSPLNDGFCVRKVPTKGTSYSFQLSFLYEVFVH